MVDVDVFGLLNYGVLGAWTLYNLWTIKIQDDRYNKTTERLISVVENNNIALTRVNDFLEIKIKQK